MIAGIVWLSAVAFLVYVIAIYPALLGLIARSRARSVAKAPVRPAVSVIVAVYNGALFLREKLESILALDYPRESIETIVVSDGSTDATDAIAGDFAERAVTLLRVEHRGKPSALNAAIAQAHGEILVLTDVRQTLAPDSVAKLVECFADPAVGVVSGELLIREGRTAGETHVGLYWRYESWIRTQLGAIDSIFGATGPFYAIRRSLARPIPPEILLDDVYLPLQAFFRGYRLIVEPAARALDYPTTIGTEFRRKVRTLAGNWQIIQSLPVLVPWKNRMWFHFVSYKFARLLLPLAVLALFVSGLFLPLGAAITVTALQMLFYALALADPHIGEGLALKRVSSPARTFAAMVIAAAAALQVFFVSPQSLWKETRIAFPHAGPRPEEADAAEMRERIY